MSSSSSSEASSSSAPAPVADAPQAPVSYGPALPPKEEWEPTDPLFMNKLPEDLSTVPGLQALQALNEEMTPEERADNFKDQGNEFFALGRHKYEEAIKCFTSAIREPGIDPKKRSTYYANRSFVNLKLENHASVIKDCKKAIELDPTNIKAYYRAASSMYETKQYQEAADMCDLGNKPRKQKQLLELKEKALAQLKIQREKEEAELRTRQEGDGEKNVLETAMRERGYQLGKKMFRAVHMYQGAPHWLNNDVATNEIIFPVILLYPEYDQSDFIQNFSEYQTFRDQLEEIFPAPGSCEWDVRREYVPDNLALYLQTNSTDLKDSDKVNYRKRVWKKISLNSTLAEALQTPEYIIPNSIPVFYVFVSGSAYCKEFLKRTD